MILLIGLGFVGIGILLLFHWTVHDFVLMISTLYDRLIQRLIFSDKKLTIKDSISSKRKKENEVEKLFKRYQKQMKQIVLFLLFVMISLFFVNKSILVIPLIFSLLQGVEIISVVSNKKQRKRLINVIESDLSLITNSYLRSNDIIKAVEENINKLQQPIKKVFLEFLFDINNTTSNIDNALEETIDKIDFFIFAEWISRVIECQRDSSLRPTLQPIISRISKIRKMEDTLETQFQEQVSTNKLLCVCNFLFLGMFYFFNAQWFSMLFNTFAGNVILSVFIMIIVFAFKKTYDLQADTSYQKIMKGVGD